VLKRHVVERCIYGVDLDPLAVELCRLSLWIETMDRTLPFSFLDHKIKCGNGLVGAWFDQFLHYPVMAWKNREGGDKGHSNGVHFEKEPAARRCATLPPVQLKRDLVELLTGQLTLFDPDDASTRGQRPSTPTRWRSWRACTTCRCRTPPSDARIYREELLAAPAWQRLKAAMDLWCACWFWPAEATRAMHRCRARWPHRRPRPRPRPPASPPRLRFFHWELEFPDVFRDCRVGLRCDPRQPAVGHRQAQLEGVLQQPRPALPHLWQAGGPAHAERLPSATSRHRADSGSTTTPTSAPSRTS
jgi:hypothetical protein